MIVLVLFWLLLPGLKADDAANFRQAAARAERFDALAARIQRVMYAWLKHADPETGLLPNRVPGGPRGLKPGSPMIYDPHNSGADLYPYLVLTAHLTDRALYNGRLLDMLRNEVRYTTVKATIPAHTREFGSGKLGEASIFGAAEYMKDGLVAVTEYLGRTPWYYRMVELAADVMENAPLQTKYGALPGDGAEVNGDMLQVLVRLATMTGDQRYLEWARRIGDAYVEEILPGSGGLPAGTWSFEKHLGDRVCRLRDHGNEMVVGLALLHALETYRQTPRAEKYRPALRRMFDRILASARPDGLLVNSIDVDTLQPVNKGLSDNWGYVYGAMYTFYQSTGETKYRDAVRHALAGVARQPLDADWGDGRGFDGLADTIESAIYLVNREPNREASAWIERMIGAMTAMQLESGMIEHWYGEGNYNRTLLLYMLMESEGCRPRDWHHGLRIGAVRDGNRLYLHLAADGHEVVRFDFPRHRLVMNFDKNYVRLNEFPEWFTVEPNRLYRVGNDVWLGSQLTEGVLLKPGNWIIEPAGAPPYAKPAQ